MPESLFATFTSSDTFSQHLCSEVTAKFLAVLEAVSDCLCRAVNSNREAINSYILDSWCQCLAGESDEAQFQAVGHGNADADGEPYFIGIVLECRVLLPILSGISCWCFGGYASHLMLDFFTPAPLPVV